MRRYETPETHAYFNGNSYVCYNLDCFIDGANLKEIDRISHGMSYTPILRCSGCGKTYFGVQIRNLEAEEEITKYTEQERTAEEERAQLAIQDNEESIEEIARLEAEQEQALRKEVEEHASELAGDITIPNIIGEPQKKNPRNDDDGDIILPNILTL